MTGVVITAIVLAAIAFGVASLRPGGGTPEPSSSGALHLHQPSLADLDRLAPGAVDASASADASPQAPLLCGGAVVSHLVAATTVAIRNSLSRISVLEYHFGSASAVEEYLHELLPPSSSGPSGGHCTLSTANSGEFYPVSLFKTNHATWEATATTSYMNGPYAGSYSYTTFEYAPQGPDLFLIRIDKQNGYPDEALMDTLLNLMNAPGSPQLSAGLHSKAPSTLRGELERAPYALVPPQGPSASTANVDCPEVVISGTPYSLVFVNQLPDVQRDGLVVSSGSTGTATTSIPWGAGVTVVVDTVGTSSNETTFGCKSGQTPTQYSLNALSVNPAP